MNAAKGLACLSTRFLCAHVCERARPCTDVDLRCPMRVLPNDKLHAVLSVVRASALGQLHQRHYVNELLLRDRVSFRGRRRPQPTSLPTRHQRTSAAATMPSTSRSSSCAMNARRPSMLNRQAPRTLRGSLSSARWHSRPVQSHATARAAALLCFTHPGVRVQSPETGPAGMRHLTCMLCSPVQGVQPATISFG